jgi:hypothetical protein
MLCPTSNNRSVPTGDILRWNGTTAKLTLAACFLQGLIVPFNGLLAPQVPQYSQG